METRIVLDVDEVLVDFVGAACELHGKEKEKVFLFNPPAVWNLPLMLGLSDEEFWKPIDEKGEEFWASLEPTPWKEKLLMYVKVFCEIYDAKVYLATSPSRHPSCKPAKEQWIKHNFGKDFEDYYIGHEKEKLASPKSVILDDREANVEKFIAAGGQGIVFPTYLNSFWNFRKDPLTLVVTLLTQSLNRIKENAPQIQ